MMMNRIRQVMQAALAAGAQAMLVLRPENRYYLSGFTGSYGALCLTANTCYLITDFRYLEQAKKQSPHLAIIRQTGSLSDTLATLTKDLGLSDLAIESHYINYKQYLDLQQKLAGVNLVPTDEIIEQKRQVKDEQEIAAIAKSMALLDQGFTYLCDLIKPGLSETQLALELEFFLRRQGATATAFPFIVASGPRSALPHGTATRRVITAGDVITVDFGVVLNQYNSDMTRTVALGTPPLELQKIYQIVLEAQLKALATVKAGVKANAVDAAARSVIESYGYGQYFGHSTGHGVGLAVHELPRLAAQDDTVLQANMVVTVEPGIYIPGLGGVRIEDSVVVEEGGCRLLTNSVKDKLLEL